MGGGCCEALFILEELLRVFKCGLTGDTAEVERVGEKRGASERSFFGPSWVDLVVGVLEDSAWSRPSGLLIGVPFGMGT